MEKIEEKILCLANIQDHGKVDCKKFAICEFGDDEDKVVVDLKVRMASLRGSTELRSRALNEFRIISTRFLGHLTQIEQLYVRKNPGFRSKVQTINSEIERRKKQKKGHDDKYLELSKDLGYLTSQATYEDTRNNVFSGGKFLLRT